MTTYNKVVYSSLVIFQITESLGSYYISTNSSSWTNGDEQCRPATPEIISCNNRVECLDIGNDIGLTVNTLWVGYYKTEMAFEYIGCVKENDIPGHQTPADESIDSNLSECYKRCKNVKVIGITKQKCYCFDSSPDTWGKNLFHSRCNAACNIPKYAACGGKFEDTLYVSLYKIKLNVIKEISTDQEEKSDKCLELNPSEQDVEWTRCNERKEVMCNDSQRLIPDRNEKLQWFKAAQVCLKNGKYPMSYSAAATIPHDSDSVVWTGVFKLDIIYKHVLGEDTKDDIFYGYLMKHRQGGYILRFTEDNSNKRILCENESNEHTTQSPSETDTGVAAIVSTTVLLIIIVVVVTVVFIHRRYTHSHRFGKMPETSESVARSEYNYPEFNYNRNEGVHGSADVEYNYPDFTVQEASDTSHCVGNAGKSPSGRSVERETYEQAKHVYGQSENDGAYNVLGTRPKREPGKTYDQAAQMQKGGTGASNDITYDLSMSSDVKLKKTLGGFTDNVYNSENQTYNKLGDEAAKPCKTDNVYGTKQMEKFKHILKPSYENDQTYNSITKTYEKSGVTDNTYSKLDTQ